MLTRILIVAFIFSMQSCQEQPSPFLEMDWLLGTWEVNDGAYFEKWEKQNAEKWVAKSFKIENENDTLILETIELVQEGEAIFYIPKVTNQNGGMPVKFKMTSDAPTHLVFENAEHDFPKKIIYQKKEDHHAAVWIEGGEQRVDFLFKKVK